MFIAPALPRDIPVNQIIITTVETIRITALLDLLLTHGKPLMLVGPTGTGKSVYTIQYLLKGRHNVPLYLMEPRYFFIQAIQIETGINTSVYTQLFMNFSAQTTANQTQDIIMGKLDKRRKGVYGPPVGKKCIIFVDDVSMPLKVSFLQKFANDRHPTATLPSSKTFHKIISHWG